jgi:hypothetical protein
MHSIWKVGSYPTTFPNLTRTPKGTRFVVLDQVVVAICLKMAWEVSISR